MSKKEKNAMPSSGAGLIRYFDEETSGIKVSPKVALVASALFGVVIILANFLA